VEKIDSDFALDAQAMANKYDSETLKLNTAFDSLAAEISDMVSQLGAEEGQVDTVQATLQPHIDAWKNTVAGFTYARGADKACCGPIDFDTKVFQTGPDYSTTTGIFTAPVTGYYYFTYHIKTKDPDTVGVQLMNHGALIEGEMRVDDNSRVGRDHLTMSSITRVLKGNQVSLKLVSKDILAGSIFSGFLVKADSALDNSNLAAFDAPMERYVHP